MDPISGIKYQDEEEEKILFKITLALTTDGSVLVPSHAELRGKKVSCVEPNGAVSSDVFAYLKMLSIQLEEQLKESRMVTQLMHALTRMWMAEAVQRVPEEEKN